MIGGEGEGNGGVNKLGGGQCPTEFYFASPFYETLNHENTP